jgi:hypothetical protein
MRSWSFNGAVSPQMSSTLDAFRSNGLQPSFLKSTRGRISLFSLSMHPCVATQRRRQRWKHSMSIAVAWMCTSLRSRRVSYSNRSTNHRNTFGDSVVRLGICWSFMAEEFRGPACCHGVDRSLLEARLEGT